MLKFGKYVCILLLITGFFVFKPNTALAFGGFTASCDQIIANSRDETTGDHPVPSPDYVMTAICRKANGGENNTLVDLNEHITNNFGQLRWLKNGGFRQSTRNCKIYPNNIIRGITALLCEARDGNGNWVNTNLVLDDEIANYDGNLTVLDGF